MASMQLTSIERVPAAGEWIRDCAIDLPRTGETLDGHAMDIAGWVVGRHTGVAEVEIRFDGNWLTGMPVQLVRPDVTRYLELADATLPSGFQVALNTIGLPQTFELSVQARLTGGRRVEFARLQGTHTLLRTSFRPALQPLSVTGSGRSGTTVLLRMLAEHPEICVHRVHPFEMRHSAYWMHVLTVLSGPANHVKSWHPDRSQPLTVGNNPYASLDASGPALRSWLVDAGPEALAVFCQQNVDAAYARIARDQGEAPGRYFAEKHSASYASRLLSHVYGGAREIVLVRDFRDIICSMVAFDRKRQNRAFQRDAADGEAFAALIAHEFRYVLRAYRERRDSALLVRYEDLITDPEGSLRRIAEYAGIDASPLTIDRMLDAVRLDDETMRAHRTIDSAAHTIGRHRHEMNEDLREYCLEIGADLLSEFGYAAGSSGVDHPHGAPAVRV